jgi:hypothetical protein
MAFPWELNLDRPHRDEKWPFPEQRVRGESTDPVLGGSAEKLEGIRPGTAEGSDRERVAASASRAADGERPQVALKRRLTFTARACARAIPISDTDVEESHLGCFATADEVLVFIRSHL